ncbi:hypothetical protein [Amantichitinum ursilacus]|uniref:PEP-CTERM protein-sorting domain-containing protein n=1 Tax=Amantichitinum ursilacus TaxID=857265 RepID=A0A0N0XK01_9NEIS|nr:hypothetical protein [Amantichitinum ursilacus]KPC51814.1 hypothetical protein WG78_15125 [Amantichitinum ursilacus]
MKTRSLTRFALVSALGLAPLYAHAQAAVMTSTTAEAATWQSAVVSADSRDDGHQTDGEAAQVLNALPFFRLAEVGLTRAASLSGGAMAEGTLGGSAGNTSGVGAGGGGARQRDIPAVPEPESWLLLTLGVPVLLARRMRTSKK